MSSVPTCPSNCQPEPGKLIPIPLGCGEVIILQPTYCEQIYIPSSEIGFCDLVLLPDTNDPVGILANLPILLLFVITAPARFLYCSLLYNSLITADFFTALQQAINTDLDLILNPFFSLIQGFINGDNGAPYEPNSVDNRAVIPQTCIFEITPIADFINAVDEVFYTIGYALGYVFYLIKYLYDSILELICFIAYLGIKICACVGIPNTNIQLGNCTGCFQPFSFLQGFVNQFINCSCFSNQFCYVVQLSLGCTYSSESGFTCYNSDPPSNSGQNNGSSSNQTNSYLSEQNSEMTSETTSEESSEITSEENSESSEYTNSSDSS